MPASENNTTFVSADNSSLLGKELEFLTVQSKNKEQILTPGNPTV